MLNVWWYAYVHTYTNTHKHKTHTGADFRRGICDNTHTYIHIQTYIHTYIHIQVLTSVALGAEYVAPYLGRMTDSGMYVCI